MPTYSAVAGAIVLDEFRVFALQTDGRTLVTFEMWLSGLRGAPAGRNNIQPTVAPRVVQTAGNLS